MPANYLMSWYPEELRWKKKHNKSQYVVSCRQLAKHYNQKIPFTKDGSYHLANMWWKEKVKTLDDSPPAIPPHPHGEIIEELQRRFDWAVKHKNMSLAGDLASRIREVRQLGADDVPDVELIDGPEIGERIKVALATGISLDPDTPNSVLLEMFGESKKWRERFTVEDGQAAIVEDETVAAYVAAWVKEKRALADTGQLDPMHFDNTRRQIEFFRDHVGPKFPANKIDEKTLAAFFSHCLKQVQSKIQGEKGWSPEYAKKVFRDSKRFIQWLYEGGIIDRPRNIDSKDHKFGVAPKRIRVMPIADFHTMYKAANGQLPLHMLLMLNCGMLPGDISSLKNSEVDWTNGRIVRKRSKTQNHEDVPTVDYKLWDETFRLLRFHRSGDEIVLKTKSGGLWCWDELQPDGTNKSANNIAVNFERLRKSLKLTEPLFTIRKLGATLIESHPLYGRFTSQYLGHSPRSIKDRSYAAPSKELFDEIIAWLGTQVGF